MVLLLCAVIHEFILSSVVANVESRIARQDELHCFRHVSIQQENLLSKLSPVCHYIYMQLVLQNCSKTL